MGNHRLMVYVDPLTSDDCVKFGSVFILPIIFRVVGFHFEILASFPGLPGLLNRFSCFFFLFLFFSFFKEKKMSGNISFCFDIFSH